MLRLYWVLVLFPLIGAFVNGLLGKRMSERAVGLIACSTVGASFLVAAAAFSQMLQFPADERIFTVTLFTWIQSGDFLSEVAFLLDPLSAVMILVVTGVGFLIHLYSIGYMAGEAGYYRFFAYMNLFIFMMSILVLADNFLLMFVGWEGVGLCSYLLIGYYFDRKSAGDAAKKAFIVNRVGDVAFILGVFLIFTTFGSVRYHTVFEGVSQTYPSPEASFGVLSAIALLLFIGATGKSAQIPLYVWLPDAMEGPTPVSALIHAATMVTAGVYMIARSAAIYTRAPEVSLLVAGIGILTALIAALIAITQTDIKKVLAYSTISQLGFMFLAVGVGAFTAGTFHLMTHAFFKALLFLGAGSVILALHHEQDLFRMGGLRRYLPITFYTMWIATFAIAGVPLFSGFFSKDEILWRAFGGLGLYRVFWGVGVAVAGLTAFYMFRLMLLAFHGERQVSGHHSPDPHHGGHEPKEPSWTVTLPLMILAFFSVFAGYLGLPAYLGQNWFEHFLEPAFHYQYFADLGPAEGHDYALEIGLTVLTTLIAFLGIWIAYVAYVKDRSMPRRLANRFGALYHALIGKFYVDEAYDAVIVRPVEKASREVLWETVDTQIIDGMVNNTGSFMQRSGRALRRIHSGHTRSYAAWILFGAVVIFLYYYAVLA
jgi:NADH-quinone oxidoreductase subunit L